MSKRTLAIIAASFVAIFYGANYTIAKDVMPKYIEPLGFLVIRVGGATILFWILGFLGPKEKIKREDYKRIFIAALFGVGINMLAFFQGLSLTSPISASVLMITTPMIVLILSAIFLKDKIEPIKIVGILIGFSGTLLLILYSKDNPKTATNPVLGNFLIFVNAAFYAAYIIVVKTIIERYHPFTFIKWMYSIGFIFILPFGIMQLLDVQFNMIPVEIYWKIMYVVVFATFGVYLLNIFALRVLKPTSVAVFVYLQPMLASMFAIGLGKDTLDSIKILAALLIFIGVYMVTKKQKPLEGSIRN